MKQKIKVLVILIMVFLLTGCIKYDVTMDIKMDKSMDFTMIFAADKTLLEKQKTSVLTVEQMKELEEQEFVIEEYEKDNLQGYKITKTIKNIDKVSTEEAGEYDLSGIAEEGSENNYIFQVKKGLIKNKYIAKFKFDKDNNALSGEDDSDSEWDWDNEDFDWNVEEDDNNTVTYRETNGEELTVVGEEDNDVQKKEAEDELDYSSLLANSMDLKLNVNLPMSALSNNATTSENNNKKLSWNLATHKEDVEFEFELYNLPVVIGIGVVALLVVFGIISTILQSTKKNNNRPVQIMNQHNNNQQNNPPQNDNVMSGNVMGNQNNNVDNQVVNDQPDQNNQMTNGNIMSQNDQNEQKTNESNGFSPLPIEQDNQNMNQQTNNRGIDPMDMPNGMNQAPFSIPEPTPSNGFEPPQQPMNNGGGESAFNIPDPVQSNLNK